MARFWRRRRRRRRKPCSIGIGERIERIAEHTSPCLSVDLAGRTEICPAILAARKGRGVRILLVPSYDDRGYAFLVVRREGGDDGAPGDATPFLHLQIWREFGQCDSNRHG